MAAANQKAREETVKSEKEWKERTAQMDKNAEEVGMNARTQIAIEAFDKHLIACEQLSQQLNRFDDQFLDTMSILKNSQSYFQSPMVLNEIRPGDLISDLDSYVAKAKMTPELTEKLKVAKEKKDEVYRKMEKIYAALLRDQACCERYPNEKEYDHLRFSLKLVVNSFENYFPGLKKPAVTSNQHPLRRSGMQQAITKLQSWHKVRDDILKARKNNNADLYHKLTIEDLSDKFFELTRYFNPAFLVGLDFIGV